MEDKYLSVITNFGCHYKCPECIVRKNKLHIPESTVGGLANLGEEIEKNNANWVSFSGGGDPLFIPKNEEEKWNEYWGWVFSICKFNEVKTELHTSYKSYTDFLTNRIDYTRRYFLSNFDRIVYHCHDPLDLLDIKRYGSNQIVRVVFVVDYTFDERDINLIVSMVKKLENIDELSFRQYVDANYRTHYIMHEYLKAGHKKDWYYIEQNDYNLYYCENKVYKKYRDIGKGDE